uniref:Putative secreted protein n=1 Tax=Ixodes ricinus TaxID=34613 RepID=A0A6B0ULZ7_IXORI
MLTAILALHPGLRHFTLTFPTMFWISGWAGTREAACTDTRQRGQELFVRSHIMMQPLQKTWRQRHSIGTRSRQWQMVQVSSSSSGGSQSSGNISGRVCSVSILCRLSKLLESSGCRRG